MIRWQALPRLRTLLLILGILAVVQMGLAVAAFLSATYDKDRGFVFPGPDRVLAIVTLIENAPKPVRGDFARALTNEQFDVRIVASPAIAMRSGGPQSMPGVERILATYLQALGGRDVVAWIAPDDPKAMVAPTMGPEKLWSRHPLKMAVELKAGDWLLIETRDNLAQGLFGFPPGFWAGIFGITVAFASLWLLWRSLSPLEGLAGALDRFAGNPVAQPVEARGSVETRRIIESVNRMQAEIAGFISDRQIMFGALSHDLRTILTRLALRIGAIEDPDTRAGAERDLSAMSAMVEDALVLTKLEAQPAPANPRFSLDELVQELRAAYPDCPLRLLAPKEINLEDVLLSGEGTGVFLALQNLMENAKAYAGEFELAITRVEGSWHFDVLDRGSGIARADRVLLLQPFMRGNDVRSAGKPGSGLGLTIADRIAKRFGGKLVLLDREGGGLTASFQIPELQVRETLQHGSTLKPIGTFGQAKL